MEFAFFGRLMLVGQCSMKSLWSASPSARPSFTKLSENWIISFFLILYMMIADHDIYWLTDPDSWKKNLVAQIWDKWAKIRPKTRFFLPFSQVWFISFPGNYIQWYNDSLEQCITSSRDKIYEKSFGGPNLGQRSKNCSWN